MSSEPKITFLEEPRKPKSDECCGGGSCCPCVWDAYRQKRQAWLKYHQEKPQADKKQANELN